MRALEMGLAAWLIGLLALVLANRFVFAWAALRRRPAPPVSERLPTVQILVAAHDERENLPALLESLDGLDYDADKLSFVFVSDGSRDGTAALLKEWASKHARAEVISLDRQEGKTAALQAAWARGPAAELTALFDADVRPMPDALRLLAAEFSDPAVGAACGAVLPLNPSESLVARYAALELWVFHQVIQAARDALRLDPPAIGAHRMFRTRALADIGGFGSRPGYTEDLETSFALVAAGWKTRFRLDAAVWTPVPKTLSEFFSQRERWALGTFRSALRRPGAASALTAAGYLERAVFLGLLLAAASSVMAWWWPLVYFAGPLSHVATALARAKKRREAARYLASAAGMFWVDVGVTLHAMFRTLFVSLRRGSPGVWN